MPISTLSSYKTLSAYCLWLWVSGYLVLYIHWGVSLHFAKVTRAERESRLWSSNEYSSFLARFSAVIFGMCSAWKQTRIRVAQHCGDFGIWHVSQGTWFSQPSLSCGCNAHLRRWVVAPASSKAGSICDDVMELRTSLRSLWGDRSLCGTPPSPLCLFFVFQSAESISFFHHYVMLRKYGITCRQEGLTLHDHISPQEVCFVVEDRS